MPLLAWNIINSLRKYVKSQTKLNHFKVSIAGKETENPNEIASEFNTFFAKVGAPDSSFKGPRDLLNNFNQPLGSMALAPVGEGEVCRIIQRLRPKKSCDVNGISVWLLKQCHRNLIAPITKLINQSFSTGVFPSQLKTSKVTPIFKKDNPGHISNYRPISILPALSKIFEKAFSERLHQFLDRFEILSQSQFGFRKNRSTIDAVTDLIETVVDGLERRQHVLSVFLDLSKAFDCVHHETLMLQLQNCGIRGLPHRWISSYLRDRDQCVQIADVTSSKIKVQYGVPQGSVLGPVLFLIYVNGLNLLIQNGKVIQYADDTTLCIKARTKQDLEIDTFTSLNHCIQTFSEINLKTNNFKSSIINFSLRHHDSGENPAAMVDEALLEETDSTRFLGMLIDKGLTWNDQIEQVCSRVASGIFALRNLSKFCSLRVLKMAYFGLIYPHVAYGIRLWGGCAKTKFDRVFRLQKKAVRVISKLNPRESCRESFRELGLLTLPCLYIYEVVVFCLSKCTLVRGVDVHPYETRGRDNFRIQQHRTRVFDRLPSQAGVRMINRLPEEFRQLNNVNKFKSRFKALLVAKAFYSVDEFMMNRWDN